MLKHAADLSDSHEYFIIWAGEANARPWGTKAEGYSLFPEYERRPDGVDLTQITVPLNAARHVTPGTYMGPSPASIERGLAVLPANLMVNEWANCILRLGTKTNPLCGWAKVLSNTASTIDVYWYVSPGSAASTPAASLGRGLGSASRDEAKARNMAYMLTPYQPIGWGPDIGPLQYDASYPAANTTYALLGRGLELPWGWAPHNSLLSTDYGVTAFEDHAVMLPLSLNEGQDGYGISEEGDASPLWIVDCTSASPMVATTRDAHGGDAIPHWLVNGDVISFEEDPDDSNINNQPGGFALSPSIYYVVNKTDTTFELSATSGGDSIDSTSTGSYVKFTHRHVVKAITGGGTVWTFTNGIVVNALYGGRLVVDWEDEVLGVSKMKRSWAYVVTNDAFTLTLGSWQGAGLIADSGGAAKIKRWSAWVDHFNDSANSFFGGEGFDYPNNMMMPYGDAAAVFPIGQHSQAGTHPAKIHCRSRGITGYAYADRFGEIPVAVPRLATATGKRISVVNLGVDSTTLGPGDIRTIETAGFTAAGSSSDFMRGYAGEAGWWNKREQHESWAPYYEQYRSSTDTNRPVRSMYQRLVKLLTTCLPNALKAEGNTRPLKCLGIVFSQGESDALSASGRQHYGQSIQAFKTSLRNLIDSLGYNPYLNGAKVPFVHPLIAKTPYETGGADDGAASSNNYYGDPFIFDADTAGLVNSAIKEHTSADEFAATITVDDLPRLATDGGHYNGIGEAELGSRIADELGNLIDHGLAHGSLSLANPQTRLIGICNLALSNIGETGQITSLEDGSEQAALCKKFLPEARDGLLQMRQWGFAVRRIVLTKINKPDAALYQHYENCYVMPPEALNAFAVLPPVEEPATIDAAVVLTPAYSATFIANGGSYFSVADSDLSIKSSVELKPVPFAVEQSPHGHRYIFTNQDDATLRYVSRVVDADQYSPHFASALSNYLGSMLAGAIIKGDEGEAVSGRLLQKTAGFVRMASSSDARQQRPEDSQRPFGFVPDHLASR
jgi:hypothetical protein